MQPKFALQFSTGNAAFEDLGYAECSRILRKIAEQLDAGFVQAIIHDANGNHVGEWSVEFAEGDDEEPDPEELEGMRAEGFGHG